MSEGRLKLRILTPARQVFDREVDRATLPAAEGDVGILPGHAALLTRLKAGEASYQDGKETEYLALSDGFLEVSGDTVTALVRSAEPGHEIDLARAERKRDERLEDLEKERKEEFEADYARLSLEKQVIRVQVARRYK